MEAGDGSAVKFRVFAAMAMAAGAMSIDSILPAFSRIRGELHLPEGSSATAGLLTLFFVGSAIGQIPMGLFADRFGRRTLVSSAAVVYLIGIGVVAISSSLGAMLVGRFVWGFGAAGLQIGAISMLRDRFVGARMAREMAFVMAVFFVVPVLAPSVGAGIIAIAPWRTVLAVSGVFGAMLFVGARLMPDTLPVERRQPFQLAVVGKGVKAIVSNGSTVRIVLMMATAFSVFSSYLGSSERIVGDVFGRKSMFPFLFGAVGILMAMVALTVGRHVMGIGLAKVIRTAAAVYSSIALVILVVVLVNHGVPPFWLYWPLLSVQLASHIGLYPNLNSAAMTRVGHLAGTASAIITTMAMLVGSLVGSVIDHTFDGTVRPLAIAFGISAVTVLALSRTIGSIEHT